MDIVLEAGTAFGSGAHPSTQLVLHALEILAAARPFSNVLDIGCGSGVLSIAAAKFMNAKVLAADIQAESLLQTQKNAALNAVSEHITTTRADGPHGPAILARSPYDLILCNVLAEVMVPWLHSLKPLLQENGIICFSGILSWQSGSFQQHLAAAGFRLVQVIADATWCAILADTSPSA